jgi:vacuolar-type H+-ATPase subunit H
MSDWNRYDSESDVSGAAYETDYRGGEGTSGGLRDRARGGITRATHTASEASGWARKGFEHYFQQHPLTTGLGVLALGIAVGMMMPSSRQEDRWLGDASDRVKERSREVAGKVGDVARTTLKEARDTARKEMEERGMDAQSLKEGAREVVNDAREVAAKSAQEARRTAEEEAERNKLR